MDPRENKENFPDNQILDSHGDKSAESIHSNGKSGNFLVKFGVLTDVQYADTEDRPAWYDHTKTRYYRASLGCVASAFKQWAAADGAKVQFALQLGDIIDGVNRYHPLGQEESLKALRRTLDTIEENPHIPTFHAVGNHELYNFKRCSLAQYFRESLLKRLKIDADLMGLQLIKQQPEIRDSKASGDDMLLYYKFTPAPGVKFIALDCFEISVIGYDPCHPNYQHAAQILERKHGHNDFDGWDIDHCLEGLEKRFQSSNGAISQRQLEWLENELAESDLKGEVVIVFGHVGLHPESCEASCLLWNYDDVLEAFDRHPSVKAYFCGHAHNQGYAYLNGIHYCVFHGIIESQPDLGSSFATISLYDDRLDIIGHGMESSRSLMFAPRASKPGSPSRGAKSGLFGLSSLTDENSNDRTECDMLKMSIFAEEEANEEEVQQPICVDVLV